MPTLDWWSTVRPDTVWVVQPTAEPTIWRVFDALGALGTVAGALIAAAVGCFAYLEHNRANKAERRLAEELSRQTKSTDGIISADAFLIYWDLRQWLEKGKDYAIVKARKEVIEWAQDMSERRAQHLPHWRQMISLAPEASAGVADAVRKAYAFAILFFERASDLVNEARDFGTMSSAAGLNGLPSLDPCFAVCQLTINTLKPMISADSLGIVKGVE